MAVGCVCSASAGGEPAKSIDYRVPEGCPGSDWFRTELGSQGVAVALPTALEVTVDKRTPIQPAVESEAAEEQYDGSLRYAAGDQHWERHLSSANCTDLLSALAVSLGLRLETASAPDEGDATTVAALAESPSETYAAATAEEGVEDRLSRKDPEKEELSRAWMLGFGAGGALRLGVDPAPSGAIGGVVLLRSERSGWGSGPFGLGFTVSPSVSKQSRVDGGSTTWSYGWWAASLSLSPGTFALPPHGRVGFVTAFHVGRYLPSGEGPGFEAQPLMFTELALRGEQTLGQWMFDAQLGLQLPVGTVVVSPGNDVLHRQRPGLMIGLGATWLGVVL